MFKQCCGCKGDVDRDDTDDEKKKPEKDEEKSEKVKIEEKDKVSLKEEKEKEVKKDKEEVNDIKEVKKDINEVNKDIKEGKKEVECEKEVLQKENEKEDNSVEKQTKNPGLTVNTDPDLETLEEYDDNAIVPITPRTAKGLTPHPAKRNSTPGLSAIPRWVSQDDEEESGGTAEPPVTPVGRDELALRRHRFFSDLLVAAQAATEHRVRFDPLGPSVAGEPGQENPLSPAVEFNSLLTRLENVTSRLEKTVSTTDSPRTLTHSNSATQVNFSPPLSTRMSSPAYQDIISGPLKSYLTLSSKIGAEVAAQAKLVNDAFQTQLQYLRLAEARTVPTQSEQASLLQPTSTVITAIQDLREKNRTSQYFNHLSAISESIPALGWVTVSPAPAPYIKEMNDAGQFYTNRVLKDWKQKDQTHVDWVKAWIETLTELQAFVKQHHTTGLVWSKTGSGAGVPPPPPPAGLPPPPLPLDTLSLADDSLDRSALFAEINKGEGITKSLKKVTPDMQTHKNAGLRTGPAPFKAAAPAPATQASSPVKGPASNKPPVFARDGKKWLVEHQRGNRNLVVEGAEMNNVVYMYGCLDSTLTVKGKVNSIFLDSCRKSAVVFDSLVSSVEFVNCQSVQMQVLGKVPTISIDKTDGCQMYLSPESLDVEIVSSKSSEMNVLVPKGSGDFTEFPIPEQFKTTVSKSGLNTVVVESKG